MRSLVGPFVPEALKQRLRPTLGRLPGSRGPHQHTSEEREAYQRALREGVVPPPHLWNLVGGVSDFVGEGRSFFDYLLAHGRLTNESRVLDVGCGLGRMAIHFALFLRSPGYYRGFDVEKRSIEWCTDAISSRFPLVSFHHANLVSQLYNSTSTTRPEDYEFPFQSGTFDLVFLASVFTHLFGPELETYLQEISRVLKPGGKCIATFYLLNDERRAQLVEGPSAFAFGVAHRGAMIERPEVPEDAVAHEESHVIEAARRSGLRLAEPIRYGAWASSIVQDQDFMVLEAA